MGARILSVLLFMCSAAAIAGDCGACGNPDCKCVQCDTKCRCCFNAQDFTPGGPVKNGIRVATDIPLSKTIKNVGGSDGAGLCVFTSAQVAAYWQNIKELDGFRSWMERRPGGGWPEKVDDMLRQFCAEKGVPVPEYVQHTGGDEAFIELALATRRMVCATYAGRDDFYRGRIAHMVNFVYLDAQVGAIIDNNRPTVVVWMTRAELLSRWRDMQGGWAFVFLKPSPPPYKTKPPQISVEQCANGQCRLPAFPAAPTPEPLVDDFGALGTGYVWIGPLRDGSNVWYRLVKDRKIVGAWYNGEYHASVDGKDSFAASASACPTDAPAQTRAAEPKKTVEENFGVDMSKVHAGRFYSRNGVEVDRHAALEALAHGSGIADDRDRYHLTFVGDSAYLAKARSAFDRIPGSLRDKFRTQYYAPGDWQVAQFDVPTGASVRKPAVDGFGAEIEVKTGDITDDILLSILDGILNPKPKPPEPKPDPKKPDDPITPAGPAQLPQWAIIGLLALAGLILVDYVGSFFKRKVA